MPAPTTPSDQVMISTRPRVTWAGCGGSRRFARLATRGLVVLLVALGPVLPVLAYASPPDPSWISGIWNGADGDDVVALVLSAFKALAAVAVAHAWLATRPIGHVLLPARDILPVPVRAGIRSRAPPVV